MSEDTRAADGSRIPPAANTFSDFIRMLSDGDIDRALSDALKEANSEITNAAIEAGGKAKGKLTLTLDFSLEGRIFTIGAKHKLDLPQPKQPKGIMWVTEDGRFTPSNPHQGQLFGVREVRGPGFRDAG